MLVLKMLAFEMKTALACSAHRLYRLRGGALIDRLAGPIVPARLLRGFICRHQRLVGLFGRGLKR